ncbi:hypothetical protein Mgra_00005648 [Meloidogyne graminicola]|uniref:Uncharacterized protein n=1 Tax=Meloidogyne graminicola TaxID=189291 RepID=A0A8S9ZP99_9BILA|nr:hypothetical protein Mgra_00005648 [Meloidogyne graminicola]
MFLLKLIECLVCVFVLFFTFLLGVTGPLGYAILKHLIQWKYRRIDDRSIITFSLTTFLFVSILLVFNCFVLDKYWRLRTFLHSKTLYIYLRQRNEIIRVIRPSFSLI